MTNIKRMGNPDGDPEQLDTTPVAMPAGFCRPTPIQEILARMVREAIEAETGEEHESEEEADDFDEETDELLDMSPYTFADIQDDYVPVLAEEDAPPEPEPQITPPSADQAPPGGETADSSDPNEPSDG